MAKDGLTVTVRITGVRETLQAFKELPKDANAELRRGSQELARALAPKIASAARAEGRQAALMASTVKARRDRVPVVVAGGSKRVGRKKMPAGGFIAAAEFGANGRYGFYARPPFAGSTGRQYKPHAGQAGYWFFKTAEAEMPMIDRGWNAMADAIIAKWAS